MGDQFYIRLAGRIRGPFSLDGLRDQIRRGTFSLNISEVSEDRKTWLQASQIHALSELARSSTSVQGQDSSVDEGEVAHPKSAQWHYTQHGRQVSSTVSTEQLGHLIRQGSIAPNEKIWNETLPDWVNVSQSQFAEGLNEFGGSRMSVHTISSATLGVTGYSLLMYCTVMLVLEMRRSQFVMSENSILLVMLAVDCLIGIGAVVLGHLAINRFLSSQGCLKERNWIVVGLSGGYTVLIVAVILSIATAVSAAGAAPTTACVKSIVNNVS